MAIPVYPRRPPPRRWMPGVLVALIAASALGFYRDAPAIIIAAAVVPGMSVAALITLLDPRSPRPWLPMFAALLWGGTVAPFAAQLVNDLALRSLPRQWVWTVVAPLFEEAMKGSALVAVLLAWRGAWRGVREGILCAALAGIGFATTENLGYYTLATVQSGWAGLARALYLRGVLEGLNHAAFTAAIGAGAGYAGVRCTSRRGALAAVLSGFAVAVAVHALWNVALSPYINDVLCNASATGACAAAPELTDLLLRIPALTGVFVGAAAALLILFVRHVEADG